MKHRKINSVNGNYGYPRILSSPTKILASPYTPSQQLIKSNKNTKLTLLNRRISHSVRKQLNLRTKPNFYIYKTQFPTKGPPTPLNELSIESIELRKPISFLYKKSYKLPETEQGKIHNKTAINLRTDTGIQADFQNDIIYNPNIRTSQNWFNQANFNENMVKPVIFKRKLTIKRNSRKNEEKLINVIQHKEEIRSKSQVKENYTTINEYKNNSEIINIRPATSAIIKRKKSCYKPYSRHFSIQCRTNSPLKVQEFSERVEKIALEKRIFSNQMLEFEKMLKKSAQNPKSKELAVQTSHDSLNQSFNKLNIKDLRNPVKMFIEAKVK